MTVSYAGSLPKQLFRWKGSVYKALWRELFVFLGLYYCVQLVYRFLMTEIQQETFEKLVISMADKAQLIPIQWLLGFFINIIVARWWIQFRTVSWPENLMVMINSVLSGDENRATRRAIARWTNLVSALAWGKRSLKIRKRFPTTAHLVRAGLMTPEEQQLYASYHTPFDKWWIPTLWILDQLRQHRDIGTYHPSLFRGLVKEVKTWRESFQKMLHFDWVCLPLVYTQVATIAVYGFFMCCILGRQLLNTKSQLYGYNAPIYFPVGTVLQFVFYVGWLKVGEALIDPFGEDDEDFELNWILDRNTYISYMMVDTCANQLPPPDPGFDPRSDRPLPYTKAAAEQFDYGPIDHLRDELPDINDMELVWSNFQTAIATTAATHGVRQRTDELFNDSWPIYIQPNYVVPSR